MGHNFAESDEKSIFRRIAKVKVTFQGVICELGLH